MIFIQNIIVCIKKGISEMTLNWRSQHRPMWPLWERVSHKRTPVSFNLGAVIGVWFWILAREIWYVWNLLCFCSHYPPVVNTSKSVHNIEPLSIYYFKKSRDLTTYSIRHLVWNNTKQMFNSLFQKMIKLARSHFLAISH